MTVLDLMALFTVIGGSFVLGFKLAYRLAWSRAEKLFKQENTDGRP